MQKIPERVGSKYRFIIIAAKRAKQLQNSATKPKIKTKSTKPAFIAMKELELDLINFEIPPAEPPSPQ